ncbi:MAG: hypothetical protein R6U58_15190 [Bacteroidales bacterium]
MTSDTQIRHQLIRRIQRIRADKLRQLDDYAAKLEENISNKEKILSFAGAWENIEGEIFNELTDNLINRRQKNKRRIDE